MIMIYTLHSIVCNTGQDEATTSIKVEVQEAGNYGIMLFPHDMLHLLDKLILFRWTGNWISDGLYYDSIITISNLNSCLLLQERYESQSKIRFVVD